MGIPIRVRRRSQQSSASQVSHACAKKDGYVEKLCCCVIQSKITRSKQKKVPSRHGLEHIFTLVAVGCDEDKAVKLNFLQMKLLSSLKANEISTGYLGSGLDPAKWVL